MSALLEPFHYGYMREAIFIAVLVSVLCAALSSYLMLKGWSLLGDALAHSVVPGVVIAYLLALPFAVGAFFSGMLAAFGMQLVKRATKLREDAIIGLVFTTFFAVGLLLVSLRPVAIDVQAIVLGNLLAITSADAWQVAIITVISLAVLAVKWRDFMLLFFDEGQARALGLPAATLKILFFTMLSAATLAALQTVGACLVIAMVVTPGATAYLLTRRFDRLMLIAMFLGSASAVLGTYTSYYLDVNPSGLIVLLQTLAFLSAFFWGRYGWRPLRSRPAAREIE